MKSNREDDSPYVGMSNIGSVSSWLRGQAPPHRAMVPNLPYICWWYRRTLKHSFPGSSGFSGFYSACETHMFHISNCLNRFSKERTSSKIATPSSYCKAQSLLNQILSNPSRQSRPPLPQLQTSPSRSSSLALYAL